MPHGVYDGKIKVKNIKVLRAFYQTFGQGT